MNLDEDVIPDVAKPELLARELECYLKLSRLPPQSYLRDLIRRSADTIHLLQPSIGAN